MTISLKAGAVLSMYVHAGHIHPTRLYDFLAVGRLSCSPFPILALTVMVRVPHDGHLRRMVPPFGPLLLMHLGGGHLT